ncbi:pentatricopeptide repeat-containing protein At2g02750 [Coffea arabica]|uniref:Pentatricopeptide repeat-containing protein At2g02750 n=1 Tax=Coffea arabica TaxID=13443 RepID=A0A6P6VGC3_COFAR|nr:pentatricopeptide repeat-containing protein At2g02750 [Coffea arabica]
MAHQISQLVRNGLYREVLALYSQLHSASVPASFLPKNFAFPFLLKACASLKALSQAQMLHAHIIRTGFQFQMHTATALTNVYMKLKLVEDATKMFDEIRKPTIDLCNAVISGFAQNGFCKEALNMFQLISCRRIRPDSVTIASGLSGCSDAEQGVQLHCLAIKIGVETDIYAATSLLTMYLNCGDLGSAEKVYGLIHCKNVVCYNAYMSGMLQNGAHLQVLNVFNEMRGSSSGNPNLVTLISVASACAKLKYLRFGRQVHGFTMKGLLRFDTKVGTALVDMYSKCGSWDSAYGVFKELGNGRSLITWNSMIAGMMLNDQSELAIELFVQLEDNQLTPDSATWNLMISGFSRLGQEAEAFLFFRKMLSENILPSLKSVTSLLTACSALSALHFGQEIHAHVLRSGISDDEFLATALIDMYMKCGKTTLAECVFNQFNIKPRDPAFWNAMISGYSRNGRSEDGFKLFYQMLEEKVHPNSATFNCMLSMCSHTGEVDLGWQIFRSMVVNYGLQPTSEQLYIMIDLLGRSGQLKEAQQLLGGITDPSASVLASLLGACEQHADFELGEEIARELSALEPDNPIPFVILSNIYAGLEKWKDVERIRDIMSKRQLKKLPASSTIGVI